MISELSENNSRALRKPKLSDGVRSLDPMMKAGPWYAAARNAWLITHK
jgi:hypothetical protein